MSNETTLITGASKGIGFHLARQFAQHGHPLILVARDQAELDTAAEELRSEYNANVRTIAKDLREDSAAQELFDSLSGESIGIVVNNAGHGESGKAWEIDVAEDLSMVRLNILAVLRLTKLFAAQFVARGSGRILNTASVAGFQPGPNYATYAATKAFVLSYTESLSEELQGTGVTITALCPGPTDTDFFPTADMVQSRAFQQANLGAPQDVAEAGYKAVMSGDRVIIPGVANKAMVFMRRLIPISLQAKLNELLTEDAPASAQKRERGDVESGAH